MKSFIGSAVCSLALVLVTACTHLQVPRTSSVTSFDGTAIAYDVAGRGDTAIVFVHCWTCDRTFWDAQFDHFAGRHTVVRLDLAGHGASGKDRERYTIAGFSKDVMAVVDKLNLKQVILVGHSMGGPVSVEAATQLGDRAIGVVAVDSFFTPFPLPKTDEEAAAFMKPFEEDFFPATNSFMEAMFVTNADPEKKAKITETIMRTDETMAIQAMHDIVRWLRFEAAEKLAKLGNRLRNINAAVQDNQKPPHESVELISGVGHFIPQMKAGEFNQVLEQVISTLPTR